jgi:hypothetical protein
VLIGYRTQLFGPDDIDKVKAIQAGYQVQPLSAFLNQPAPPAAPVIDFVKPLTPDQQKTAPELFNILNFVMRDNPTLPTEKDLRARFATIGIGPEGAFNAAELTPEMRTAVEGGMAGAWAELDALKDKLDTGQVTAGDLFGTREVLGDNYLYRMAGAVLGIYGNSVQEAMYPAFSTDSTGAPLTGANNYTYRFPSGQLPPVNAFWSLTMYELPSSLLVAQRPRRRHHALHPKHLTRPRQGGQLAARTARPVPDVRATVLAQTRGIERSVEDPATAEGLALYWSRDWVELTTLLAGAGDSRDDPIAVAIETPRGLLVAAVPRHL